MIGSVRDEVIRLVSGKRVLEIGALGDFEEYLRQGTGDWQHEIVRRHAASVLGVDINREYVSLARERGFEYQYGDIEDADSLPSGAFDVVLMVDVIEHLNNVGLALESLKSRLGHSGKLVITTPSPWAANNLVRLLLGRRPSVYEDHTVYIVEQNFKQLAKRYSYNIDSVKYLTAIDRRTMRTRIGSFVIAMAAHFNPLMASTIWIEMSVD